VCKQTMATDLNPDSSLYCVVLVAFESENLLGTAVQFQPLPLSLKCSQTHDFLERHL
jgi:hypothetical protein